MSLKVAIRYDIENPEKTILKTNANKSGVSEILENWLRSQIGEGRDTSTPIERDQYTIKIELNLSNDSFRTKSDTGNESLTCGIVRDVFDRLDKLKLTAV